MLNDKSILITGGTGSFGKKFAKRALTYFNPKKVSSTQETSISSI